MSRTRQGVYAGLVHGIRTAGHSDKHEISVRKVIARAASYGTAVIRCFVTRICPGVLRFVLHDMVVTRAKRPQMTAQSEEHTSELQSLAYLVCRLLLEKKKQK